MRFVPYTNTYADVDGSVADSDDIVAEFDRVSTFIKAWNKAYQLISFSGVNEYNISEDGDVNILPSLGFMQVVKVDSNVTTVNINANQRGDEDPYRVYLSLRFGSKNTTFTVSAPAGESHLFGLNQETYNPSQVAKDGWYAAVIIITYGTDAAHVQVFAHNSESSSADIGDILQEISI